MVSQRCKQYKTTLSLTSNPPLPSLSLEVPLPYWQGGQTLEQAPKEVVDAPCLSVFNKHLDNTFNNSL